MNTPMQYNQCKTCGAGGGRAGVLINGDCKNCYDTRQSGAAVVHADLQRAQGELAKTFNIIAEQIMKKYAISSNNVDWDSECYDTREEAISAGIGEYMGDIFWIGEARQPASPELFYHFSSVFDYLVFDEDYSIDAAVDYVEKLDKLKPEITDELEAKIQPIIKEWLEKHKLMPTFYVVENVEKIDPEKIMTTKAKPIRRIKIDWRNISEQTGCKRGTLCKVFDQWVIKDGDDLNHICIIDPPETAENEELRIENNEWVIYGKEAE